jgi:hypothetical protein
VFSFFIILLGIQSGAGGMQRHETRWNKPEWQWQAGQRVCVLARLYPGSGQWIRFFTSSCVALLLVLTF